MVSRRRSESTGPSGSPALVAHELRVFKADILGALFRLGTIQMAAVNPTPTAIAAATTALLEIHEVAGHALDASQIVVGEDGPAGDDEGEDIDQLEEEDDAVESEESSSASDDEEDGESDSGDDVEMNTE